MFIRRSLSLTHHLRFATLYCLTVPLCEVKRIMGLSDRGRACLAHDPTAPVGTFSPHPGPQAIPRTHARFAVPCRVRLHVTSSFRALGTWPGSAATSPSHTPL